ncbi:FGF-1 [Pieris rapae granulovirus Wuhan]|uniref:FGF-1 n=1 Tax=Pieris rapae granulovirus Wuhan TaxID=2848030 RepID=D2J4M9_9BBAC|nr:FGF-1 [Betabaculovirus arrapae]ACZ63548.1 FGF-1 [Betabaculovirus arrapae]AGS18822.1 FGF-1 [Pieris rapae granulovirus]UOS85737.1 FGF-1 [Pieris rapae granulovirus]
MLLFATISFCFLLIEIVYCVGTLHPLNRPLYNFCLLTDNNIQIRANDDVSCKVIEFNIHKYDNNLILNFMNRNRICNYMCIDKCGNVYHDSVFYTEDCKFTTAAIENIETLSVYRGNYSDFFAADTYYTIPLSMKAGDSIERFYNYVALKYNVVNNQQTCKLLLTPSKTSRTCTTVFERRGDLEYIDRQHYRDYSFWNKILIMFGIKHYVVPNNTTLLSYTEYNDE